VVAACLAAYSSLVGVLVQTAAFFIQGTGSSYVWPCSQARGRRWNCLAQR
jgi:hypothetical protein